MKLPRVLLADDHPALLALTAAALAGECLVVDSVGDGRELLAEAERLHPDVIVLDCATHLIPDPKTTYQVVDYGRTVGSRPFLESRMEIAGMTQKNQKKKFFLCQIRWLGGARFPLPHPLTTRPRSRGSGMDADL